MKLEEYYVGETVIIFSSRLHSLFC